MSELAPHQQRVVDEKKELDDKRMKLHAFNNSEKFNSVSSEERYRLLRQLSVMTDYSLILGERIAAF